MLKYLTPRYFNTRIKITYWDFHQIKNQSYPRLNYILSSNSSNRFANGALLGIRTPDRCLRRALLYPAELTERFCSNEHLNYITEIY